MNNNFDNSITEALNLFKALAAADDRQVAAQLWYVLGDLYNSSRSISDNDLEIINEFAGSINFALQFSTASTFGKVAKELRPEIVKRYNLGQTQKDK